MSWGSAEYSGERAYDGILTTPYGHNGVTFVAASGDTGGLDSYPAMSPNVVSVGGTNLSVDASGYYLSETAWSQGGGGFSKVESEPNFQRGVQTIGVRTGPDVAYNAGTNMYQYWTQPSTGRVYFFGDGGTSAGAPQWAAIIAIADQIRVAAGEHTLDGPSQTLYALYSSTMTSSFHDITTGSNGYPAGPGYDLATGLGTPYAQYIILNLARVNDSYHGSAAPSVRGLAGSHASSQTLNSPAYEGDQTLVSALSLPAAGRSTTSSCQTSSAVRDRGLELVPIGQQNPGVETTWPSLGRHSRTQAANMESEFLATDALFADFLGNERPVW